MSENKLKKYAGLSWEDRYPKSYNYPKTCELNRIKEKIDDALKKMKNNG